MKNPIPRAFLLTALLLQGTSWAASPALEVGRAIIVGVVGKAEVRAPLATKHDGRTTESQARLGDAYSAGHTLSTGLASRLASVLTPGAVLGLSADTQVRLDELSDRPQGRPGASAEYIRRIKLTLDKGTIRINAGESKPNKKFQVDVGLVSATFDGGEHEFTRMGDKGLITALQGKVTITTKGGETITIEPGSTVELDFSNPDKPVLTRRETRPEDRMKAVDTAFFEQILAQVQEHVLKGDHVNVSAIAGLLGIEGGVLTLVGDPQLWEDVSPSSRVRSSR